MADPSDPLPKTLKPRRLGQLIVRTS